LQHLGRAADEWQASGRPPDDLYSAHRLAALDEAGNAGAIALAPLEDEFVTASRTAIEDGAASERRRATRLRRAFGIAVVGLVIALVAGSVALVQRNRANDERARAGTAATEAEQAALDATSPA
jgi:hypothetical protein